MAAPLVPDELWEVVEPLIPKVERRYRYPGRKRVPDRQALTGILFVLKTGIPWEALPQEIGLRLRGHLLAAPGRVAKAGRLAKAARSAPGKAQRRRSDRLEQSRGRLLPRACLWGGEKTGPSPVDRRKPGSKHHLITCGAGHPLAAETTAANVNDITRFVTLVDAVPAVRGRRGRPRRRPKSVYGDRAYHSRKSRREMHRRRVKVRVARSSDPHGSGLGRKRWVVERTIAWLHQYRRLRVRYERRADIHDAFLAIGCCLICFKQLQAAGSL